MPNSPARVFRVFVSSTFSDLIEERNLLQESVFPRLRDLCARRGARFQPVDLRWGVSQAASQEQRTMSICLEEIERCQQTRRRPNFLIILGDRYGWRPLPSEIPVADAERMLGTSALRGGTSMFQSLYPEIDWNAVPPVYCLSPRAAEIEWARPGTERDVLAALEGAAAEIGLPALERVKYGGSATEQEIVCGLLKEEPHPGTRTDVHAFLRNFRGEPDHDRCKVLLDRTKGGIDTNAGERQQALKARLREVLRACAHDYDISLPSPQTGAAASAAPGVLADIQDAVYEALAGVIEAEIGGPRQADPGDENKREFQAHVDFADERSHNFIGRTKVLDQVNNYLRSPDQKVFAVIGPSGSGKSAAMARALTIAQEEHAQAAFAVRFIGVTPASSAGMSLLAGLTRQISEIYGGSGASVFADYPRMAGEFRKCLELASEARPLILFVDALDQLPRSDYARSMSWLPFETLPEHVHVVISVSSDAGELAAAVEKRLDGGHSAHLLPLPVDEADRILDLWLKDARRSLQGQQRASLIESFAASGLPLHLRLAFEQARLCRSFDPAPKRSSKISQAISEVFAWLSTPTNHGETLVSKGLGYLTAAKDGLSEDELIDLMSLDDRVMKDFRRRFPDSPEVDRLPMIIWSRLYYDLKPYLTERDAHGAVVLNYFHRQLREAALAQYLGPESKTNTHERLANYFLKRPNFQADNGERAFDARKLSELPYQERKAGMWDKLEATLCDLSFIEAKCGAGLIYDLLADYDAALLKSGLADGPKSRVAGFRQFVRAQSHLLSSHPHLTLQQALNEPDITAPAHAAAEAAEKDPRPRFRLINKSQAVSPCMMTLYAHTGYVNSCDISRDQSRIASGSSDKEIKIWDAETGKEVQTLRGHTAPVETCSFSPDGLRIVSGSRNGEVKVWDAISGDELWHGAHQEPVPSCRFSPDGKHVASVSWDGGLRLWDAANGKEKYTVHAHQGQAYSADFSPDGTLIATVGGDGMLKVRKAATGEEVRSVAAHKQAVMSCRFSRKENRLFTASQDMTLKCWDADTLEELHTYGEHETFSWAVAVSSEGDLVASGCADGSIHLFDVESGAELAAAQEHTNEIWELTFFDDGTRLVSVSWDGTLKIWDVGELQRQERPAEALSSDQPQLWGYPIPCACSPDGTRYAAGSSDGSIRLWNADTGKQLLVFPVHDDFVYCCAFSPDSRWIISGAMNGSLKVFDTREQQITAEARSKNQKTISFCAFTRDGTRVIACSAEEIRTWLFEDGRLQDHASWPAGEDEEEHFSGCAVRPDGNSIIALRHGRFDIWDTAAERFAGSIPGQSDVALVTLSTDGRTLAALSDDGTARLWNVETRTQLRELEGRAPGPVSCNFSRDGNRLVVGSRDHTISVWDLQSADGPMVLKGHTDELQDTCFTHDGSRVLSASVDGTLRLWDARAGASVGLLHWPATSASACVWSADGRSVATASHRHQIKLWNSASGQIERTLSGHSGAILECKFLPGRGLLSASADGTMRLWDPDTSEVMLLMQGHDGPVRACDFSPAGDWIVSAGNDGSVRLWDARTGELLRTLLGHTDWVTLVRVIAGGSRIVSGSVDRTVRIWDSATGQLLHTLHAHEAALSAAAADRDSSRVVTGDEAGALHVWGVESGSLAGTLRGHTGAVRVCAWPAGIVSASQDGTVRLWDAEAAAPRVELKHNGPVLACAVSGDRRLVASGSEDQFVNVWEAATGRRVAEYWAGAAIRSLSWQPNGRRLAVGVVTGRLHLLNLEEGSGSGGSN